MHWYSSGFLARRIKNRCVPPYVMCLPFGWICGSSNLEELNGLYTVDKPISRKTTHTLESRGVDQVLIEERPNCGLRSCAIGAFALFGSCFFEGRLRLGTHCIWVFVKNMFYLVTHPLRVEANLTLFVCVQASLRCLG